MFGYSFEKPEIVNGTKYFAVLTAPIEIRPAVLPGIISIEVSQIADRRLDPLGKGNHIAPGVGQQHAFAGALKQGNAGQRLQVLDLQRDGGLGQMKLLGRGGNRTVLCGRGQRAQLAKGQFPQKAACHRAPHYKKYFGLPKDKEISLI